MHIGAEPLCGPQEELWRRAGRPCGRGASTEVAAPPPPSSLPPGLPEASGSPAAGRVALRRTEGSQAFPARVRVKPAPQQRASSSNKPSPELDQSVRQKGHTHYAQLHPFICAFPETTFICVHWSLRYSREDILGFFNSSYGGVPKNVVLWV